MKARIFAPVIVVAALFAASGATVAAEPAYVGTWGVDAAQCRKPQDVQGAPMIVRRDGYDQHEAHCAFTSVKNAGSGWSVVAACSVEGDKQRHTFKLAVAGGRLVMDEGGSVSRFIRCR